MAVQDDQVIGTAALIRHAQGVLPAGKDDGRQQCPRARVGRHMLRVVLDEAKLLGAHRLFLGSSTKLEKAVRLYESMGFRHVPKSNIPELEYARASVFMEIEIE